MGPSPTRGSRAAEGGPGHQLLIADGLAPLEGELAISAVSLAEPSFGVLVSPHLEVRTARLRRLSVLQASFAPLPVDAAVASSYAALASAVVAVGRQPRSRVMDLLIAATAHAHSARLYTRNAEDLRGLEDLLEIVTAPPCLSTPPA